MSYVELKSLFSDVELYDNFAHSMSEPETIKNIAHTLGGTIKIGEILFEWIEKKNILKQLTDTIMDCTEEWKKLRVWLDIFIPSMDKYAFKVKDELKNLWKSIRIVQHENGRIKTATTIHEKLITHGIELMVYHSWQGICIARTIWIQDIESYTDRDMNRDRNMKVGMMPPKVAQIMINLWSLNDKDVIVWDPFCGLWTTLIEALHSGYNDVMWSDISEEMVIVTDKNIKRYKQESWKSTIFTLDATKIDTIHLKKKTVIVTEGMLGLNFNTGSVTIEQVLKERNTLIKLYEWFLDSSWKNNAIERMVFCMPFWNIRQEVISMPEIKSLTKTWKIDDKCLDWKRYLIHIREGQTVGREIIILKRR